MEDWRKRIPAMPDNAEKRKTMIEVVYRPEFWIRNKEGGYEGRLKANHGVWGAGSTEDEAILECLRAWRSLLAPPAPGGVGDE